MKILLAGLGEGVHEYSFREEPAALGLDGGFSTIAVDAVLEKSDHELFLNVRLQTEASCVCDRCLTPFSVALTPAYAMHYVYRESDAVPYDPVEVQVLQPGTTSIEIAEDVRQTVVMAVPLKLLCMETCRGLCSRCGKNLNEGPCDCRPEPSDSRWDALRDLKIQ